MTEIFFWDSSEVIQIHDSILAKYEEDPRYGFKDGEAALESALHRPKQYRYYQNYNLPKMAAVYAHAIADGHIFIDGNKRTASKVSEVFLAKNGYFLLMSSIVFEDLLVRIADPQSSDWVNLEYLAELFDIFALPLEADLDVESLQMESGFELVTNPENIDHGL